MTIDRRTLLGTLAVAPLATGLAAPALQAQAPTEIVFNFPIAVGGPIPRIIDGYCEDFARENPRFRVKPIYAGSYQDTLTKSLTAMRGGDAPHLACVLAVDIFTLIGEDAILAWDDLPGADRGWPKPESATLPWSRVPPWPSRSQAPRWRACAR
jgi:sn-glycerol 3-phosphate transport system substrate-binding protein